MGVNRCHIAIIVSFAALLVSLFGNFTLYQIAHNNNQTLCALKNDLQVRYDAGQAFLKDHPNGIPGIPRSALLVSLRNQRATLESLKNLDCL